MLLGVDHVEEAVFGVAVLFEDFRDAGLVLHEELAVGKQNQALLRITADLQLLLDDGENLSHFEVAGDQEPSTW